MAKKKVYVNKKKSKTAKVHNMNDFLLEEQIKNPEKEMTAEQKVVLDDYVNKLNKEQEIFAEYNKNIKDIESLYTDFIPSRKVLVRVYCKEHIQLESGLIIPNYTKIPVVTQNNVGVKKYVQSKYPVMHKAVVVSSPEHLKITYKTGDVVQLQDIPVRCPIPNNETQVPMYAFVHADRGMDIPSDVKHPDYGYYLIPSELIDGHISKVN